MAKTSVSRDEVIANLLDVPPAELAALALLHKATIKPGTWFPANVPPAKLAAAAKELVAYGERCQKVADALKNLEATAIDRSVPEFGL